ncbi:DUF7848 domain-containing protein [Streptomyces johnsoniae]
MGTRRRFRNCILTPNHDSDAAPVKVACECADFGEKGPIEEETETAQKWTFAH